MTILVLLNQVVYIHPDGEKVLKQIQTMIIVLFLEKMPGWSAEEVPRGIVQGQVGMVFVTIQMLTAVINNT